MPASRAPKAKEPASTALSSYGLTEVGICSVFNGFFLALSVIDLAIDSYALASGDFRTGLLAAFYTFKHNERVVSSVVIGSAIFIPFVLYLAVVEDVRGLWLRPHHKKRHVAGSVGLVALLGLIALTAAVVRPAEATLAAGTGSRADAITVWWLHVIVAAANAAQLPLPFVKAAGAVEGDAAEAVSASAAAVGESDAATEPAPAAEIRAVAKSSALRRRRAQ